MDGHGDCKRSKWSGGSPWVAKRLGDLAMWVCVSWVLLWVFLGGAHGGVRLRIGTPHPPLYRASTQTTFRETSYSGPTEPADDITPDTNTQFAAD